MTINFRIIEGDIDLLVDNDIIRTDLRTLKEACAFIKQLRDIPKTVLESGELEMYHYRKIASEFNNHVAREYIKNNVNNPIWDLAIYLED